MIILNLRLKFEVCTEPTISLQHCSYKRIPRLVFYAAYFFMRSTSVSPLAHLNGYVANYRYTSSRGATYHTLLEATKVSSSYAQLG